MVSTGYGVVRIFRFGLLAFFALFIFFVGVLAVGLRDPSVVRVFIFFDFSLRFFWFIDIFHSFMATFCPRLALFQWEFA